LLLAMVKNDEEKRFVDARCETVDTGLNSAVTRKAGANGHICVLSILIL
jgi:hypothetical protein